MQRLPAPWRRPRGTRVLGGNGVSYADITP